jgi:hypothetical protein
VAAVLFPTTVAAVLSSLEEGTLSHRPFVARRPRRTAIVAAASFATALTTLSGVGTADAAAPPIPGKQCTPFDDDADLDNAALRGTPVTGLTVTQGTEPDTFSGEVLGVMDDGIAPGVDMIMARLTSTEIDRVGIWAGMSGSPVYAPDGTLLGAVAYGLAFGPSAVAGITPAAAMLDVAAGASPARTARKVDIPASLQRTLTARTGISPRAADAGLASLKTPVAVSGVTSDKRLRKVKRTLGLSDVTLYRAAPAAAEPGQPATIKAGGNLAVSLTYGTFSTTGIGTVTAVCDGMVVGFGHPFTFTGPATLTMQSADAIYIQEDPTFSGFKVANATGPVGTISQDRLAGVAGTLGPAPVAVPITSTASVDEDGDGTVESTHEAVTYASAQEYVAEATFLQTLFIQDRAFDRFGPGSGRGRFAVTGSSDEGGPFALGRTNRYATRGDLSFDMAIDAPIAIDRLARNKFTDLTFDRVTTDSVMTPEPRLFRVGRVEQRVAGEWSKLSRFGTVEARAGKTLRFRVTLTSYRNRYGSMVEHVRIKVPKSAKHGGFGYLVIGGGTQFGGSGRPDSFNALVEKLQGAPRNDELVASMYVNPRRAPVIRTEKGRRIGEVVTGGRFYELSVNAAGQGGGSNGPVCRAAARGC